MQKKLNQHQKNTSSESQTLTTKAISCLCDCNQKVIRCLLSVSVLPKRELSQLKQLSNCELLHNYVGRARAGLKNHYLSR